jgi:HK97 family phage prohead protease
VIHKTFTTTIKSADAGSGQANALFSVYGVKDRQGDIVEYGALTDAMRQGPKPTVVYSHNWSDLDSVLGKVVSWGDLAPGSASLPTNLQQYGAAYANVKFNLNVPAGKTAFELVKSGDLNQWSWAFDVAPDGERHDEKGVRRISKVSSIYEVSLVLQGANALTTTTAAKAMTEAMVKTIEMRRPGTDAAWLPDVIAKAYENEKRQADATITAYPLLAECAAAILMSLDNRLQTLFEYAETNRFDSYLPVAIHESSHAVAAQHYGLQPTAIKLHRNGNGGCDTPGGNISRVDDAAIDLAGLLGERIWHVDSVGKQLNSVDASRPASLTSSERETANHSADDILKANHALVATLALSLYRKAKDGDGVVSGQEIHDISQMVDYLKDLSRAELQKVYRDVRNKRMGYPSWM